MKILHYRLSGDINNYSKSILFTYNMFICTIVFKILYLWIMQIINNYVEEFAIRLM